MKNKKGFTLIEIMVVVIILGLLCGHSAAKILGREEEAKVSAAKVQIKSMESALDGSNWIMAFIDHGPGFKRFDQEARSGSHS